MWSIERFFFLPSIAVFTKITHSLVFNDCLGLSQVELVSPVPIRKHKCPNRVSVI